jgi:hypothetical protein
MQKEDSALPRVLRFYTLFVCGFCFLFLVSCFLFLVSCFLILGSDSNAHCLLHLLLIPLLKPLTVHCGIGDSVELLLKDIDLLVQLHLLSDVHLLHLLLVITDAVLNLLVEKCVHLLLKGLLLGRDGVQLIQKSLLLLGTLIRAAARAVVGRSAHIADMLLPDVRESLVASELLQTVTQRHRPRGNGRLVIREARGPEGSNKAPAVGALRIFTLEMDRPSILPEKAARDFHRETPTSLNRTAGAHNGIRLVHVGRLAEQVHALALINSHLV